MASCWSAWGSQTTPVAFGIQLKLALLFPRLHNTGGPSPVLSVVRKGGGQEKAALGRTCRCVAMG